MASVTDFVNANSHNNTVTGCTIWDGELGRGGNPTLEISGMKMEVHALVYASANGAQPNRTKYNTLCENPRCVRLDHIEAVTPEKKQVEYDPDVVESVRQMFFVAGKRQDIIATELGMSQSQVSKIVNYIRRDMRTQEEVSKRGG